MHSIKPNTTATDLHRCMRWKPDPVLACDAVCRKAWSAFLGAFCTVARATLSVWILS